MGTQKCSPDTQECSQDTELLPGHTELLPGHTRVLPGHTEVIPGHTELLPGYTELLYRHPYINDFSTRPPNHLAQQYSHRATQPLSYPGTEMASAGARSVRIFIFS